MEGLGKKTNTDKCLLCTGITHVIPHKIISTFQRVDIVLSLYR